jgi:hypothetical protein
VEVYQRIRGTLEGLAGRINGAHAGLDWVPIRYVNQAYPRDALAGVYRASRIGLVTPLRDGMNLVAKEYVAAQDPEDPGVLILSRFAGAAETMREAILVNPHSAEDMADALLQALAMPLEERKRRWTLLMRDVQEQDVMWWLHRFTSAWLKTIGPKSQIRSRGKLLPEKNATCRPSGNNRRISGIETTAGVERAAKLINLRLLVGKGFVRDIGGHVARIAALGRHAAGIDMPVEQAGLKRLAHMGVGPVFLDRSRIMMPSRSDTWPARSISALVPAMSG